MRLIFMVATWVESPIHVPMSDSFQTTAQLLCELSATYTGFLTGNHDRYDYTANLILLRLAGTRQIFAAFAQGKSGFHVIGMEGIADCFYDQKVCSSVVKKS